MTNLRKLFDEYRALIGNKSKIRRECIEKMGDGVNDTAVAAAYRSAYHTLERAVDFCRHISICDASAREDFFKVCYEGDPYATLWVNRYSSAYFSYFLSKPEFDHINFRRDDNEGRNSRFLVVDREQYAETMMLTVQIALDRVLKARILNKLDNDETFAVAVEFNGSARIESIESVDCLDEIIRSMRKVARLDNFKYIEIMRFNAEHSIIFRTHTNADAARRSFEAYLELSADLDREVEERSRRELRSDIIALGVKVVDEPQIECKQSKVDSKKARRWHFRKLAADELAKRSVDVEFISSADFVDNDRRRYDPDEYVDDIDHSIEVQRAVEELDERVMLADLEAGIEPQFSFDFTRHSAVHDIRRNGNK